MVETIRQIAKTSFSKEIKMSRTIEMNRGDKVQRSINLIDITVAHNPRTPVPNLSKNLFQKNLENYIDNYLGLVHDYALSDDSEKQSLFVQLMEEYENHPKGIVELAASRRKQALQPINVRRFRSLDRINSTKTNKVYLVRYGIISGERRTLAAAYNHAKHGDDPVICSDVSEISLKDAEGLAFDENFQRLEMTDLEIGLYFRTKYESRKEKVDGRYSLNQFAKEIGNDYQYIRSRIDITYLPQELRDKLESDKLGITKATQIGAEIRQKKRNKDGSTKDGNFKLPEKSNFRIRTKTVKEIKEHVSEKHGSVSSDYLSALAWVLELQLGELIEMSCVDS